MQPSARYTIADLVRNRNVPLKASDEVKWTRKAGDGPVPAGFTMQPEDRECATRIEQEERCKEYMFIDVPYGLGFARLSCTLEKNHPEPCQWDDPDDVNDFDYCGHMLIDDTTYGRGMALECQLPVNHRGEHSYNELSAQDRSIWDSLLQEQGVSRIEEEERIRDAQATTIIRVNDELRSKVQAARDKGIHIVGKM